MSTTVPMNAPLPGSASPSAPHRSRWLESLLYRGRARICPSCNRQLYPGACAIVSAPDERLLTVPQLLEPAPRGWRRPLAILFPRPLNGEYYTRQMAVRLCPYPDCGYPLPYNIERARKLTIAIVGDVSSGKSVYISVLLRLLEEGRFLASWQRGRMSCLTNASRERYEKEYVSRLFKDHVVPPGSRRAEETTHHPLIYELFLQEGPDEAVKNFNLILYDTSGEDYVIPSRQVQYAPYLLNADAIIFLIDPVSIPGIRENLLEDPGMRYGHGDSTSPPFESFNKIMQPIERTIVGRSASKKPLVLALSKADVLKKLRAVRDQYRFLVKAPDYRHGLNLADIEQVDHEVRNLLLEHGETSLIQAVARSSFRHVRFMAFSAIGYTPDANGRVPAIKPWRCLDPLLWVLYQLGLIRPGEQQLP
jgi:GTPase SAR1 family protein